MLKGLRSFQKTTPNKSSSSQKGRTESFSGKKTEKRGSRQLLYLFFVSGMLGTGYLLSPYGHMHQINVEGDSEVPDQHIIDASAITSKKTMVGIFADKNRIESQIRGKLPQIKSAAVNWQGVNDVQIQVADYHTTAYLQTNSQYQAVLETGEVLEEKLAVPRGSRPILKDFKKNEQLKELIRQLNEVSEEIKSGISEISYTGNSANPNAVTFFMNDGNQIKADLKDFPEKIAYYPDIIGQLDNQKGTIHMETGVYFEPFAKEKNADQEPGDTEEAEGETQSAEEQEAENEGSFD